jgi:hypothetical protein
LEDVGTIPHADTRIDTKGRQQPATKAERIAVAKDQVVDPRARKLCAWLMTVEADGYLTTPPAKLLRTMTPDMRANLHGLGARVGTWLLELSEAASKTEGEAA